MTSRSRLALIGACWIGAAAVVVGGWCWYANYATPVTLPISGNGLVQSPAFYVVDAVPYDVSLEIDRRFSFENTECLLGVGLAPESLRCERRRDCTINDHPPLVRWTIYENGRALTGGVSGSDRCGYFTDDYGGFDMGVAHLKSFTAYVVRAQVDGASPSLLVAKPRLVVHENSMSVEQGAFLSVIPWAFGLISALVGVFTLFRAFLSRSDSRLPVS